MGYEPCSVFSPQLISFPQDLGGKGGVPLFNVNFLYFSLCTVLVWGFSGETGSCAMDPSEMLVPRVGSSEVLWLEWLTGNLEQEDPGVGTEQPLCLHRNLFQSDLINASPSLWQNTLCALGGQSVPL